MKVTRTEQIYIKKDETISYMCHLSKNLYNQVNYILLNQFLRHEKLSGYTVLSKQFSIPSDNEEYNNYQKLPAQTAQWTIKISIQSWNPFFKALKTLKKHPDKFIKMPRSPHYKNRNGEFMLIFTNQQCKIDKGILKFPKIMGSEVKTRLENVDLREVRIIPQIVGYVIEIVYTKETAGIKQFALKPQRVMGIDIGVRNLVTIGNNFSEKGIVIKAGSLKSTNQFFNKELSRLRGINDLQGNEKKSTKHIRKLFVNRNHKIKNFMHKISRSIINYAMKSKVDTIVIGHNDGWKQNVNIGKTNNQKFVQIPFNKLIQQIQYKAEEQGIEVKIANESHTSKCSFLDNESIEHHDNYMGKRVKRGAFQSGLGKIIHADLNGAYNIIKKAIPDAFVDGIEGIGLYPRSLSIKQMITSKGGC